MRIENDYFVLPTDEAALAKGYYKDNRLPELICKFLETFRIESDDYSGPAGRPFQLLYWQRATVYTAYGWRRPDGRLRFTQVSCWVPRRSGKSILVSGLSLFHAIKDKKAEVLVLASTKEQAGIIYRYAESFAYSNPSIANAQEPKLGRIKPVPSHKVLRDQKTGSTIKVVSCDKVGKSGTSTSLLLADELHEWPKVYAREVWSRLTPSLGSRVNSLIFNISTAGTEKDSLAWDLYKDGKDVLEGKSDDLHLLPIIYECPEFSDWTDEANWWPALPSAGLTVSKDFYHETFAKARGNPLDEVSWRRQYLNQWCGAPEQWLPSDLWEACAAKYSEQDFYGQPCILGIDYGASYDLTSWCLIFERDETYYVLPRFAIPREVAKEQQEQMGTPYTQWAADPRNHLYFTDGNTVDADFLIAKIKQEQQKFRIKQCRYDKTRLEVIRQQIANMGIETIAVSPHATTMSPAFSFFERLVRENTLRHPNNPILNWNLEGCRPKKNNNDQLMIVKAANSSKIDGIDAACFALTYWLDGKGKLPVAPQGQRWVVVV